MLDQNLTGNEKYEIYLFLIIMTNYVMSKYNKLLAFFELSDYALEST